MKDSYLFLADGFEEMEAIGCIDVLRRAGMPLKTVSITNSMQVTGAHGVKITADLIFDNVTFAGAEWLILPGGMPGATNLYEFAPLRGLLRSQAESAGGRIAAICASPAVVLGQLGLLKGENATCYPGFENLLSGAEAVDAPVVTSGKFVLGNGPGNVFAWALTIVKETLGEQKALSLGGDLLIYPLSSDDLDFTFG